MLTVFGINFIAFANFSVLQGFTLKSDCLENDCSKTDDCELDIRLHLHKQKEYN
jgi:hypothetical protein